MARLHSNTFTGTQKGLTYTGTGDVYAYSGWQAVATGSDTLLLDFVTENLLTKCKLYWGFDYDLLENGKYFGIEVKLNGVVVMRPRAEQRISGSGHGTELIDELKMIIPPNTHCIINAQTDDGGTEAGCVITGKVLK